MWDGNRSTLRGRLEGRDVGGSNLVRIGGIWIGAGVAALVVAAVVPSLNLLGAIGVVAALATLADIAHSPARSEPSEGGSDDGASPARPEPSGEGPEGERAPPVADELNAQGFDLLDRDEFENREVDPEYCWRRPFTFTEIYEGIPELDGGIPIDRQRPTDERPSVVGELLADLEDGGGALLVGDPGAGKTTTTRQVAAAWYGRDDTGPVIYREEGGDPITEPDALSTAIAESAAPDEPALVVVEDAARYGTIPFYETLQDLEPDEDVSVLLNAREREWENLDERAAGHETIDTTTDSGTDALETRFRYVRRREMPPLDEREIERLLERFEAVTGRTVTADPADLLTRTRTERGASQMLLLSYNLPIGDLETDVDGQTSALEDNVTRTYRRINGPDADPRLLDDVDDDDERLLGDVALLAAVVAAAELPLYKDLLCAVGDDADAFQAIDRAVTALDGYLFFGRDDDGRLRSHHPIWAELYLGKHLDMAGSEQIACERFERVVNGLFGLLDEESRREAVREYLRRPLRPDRIETNPSRLADEFVRAVFDVGEGRPSLVPLFGTTEYSGITVPDACSPETRVHVALSRHRMYHDLGERKLATAELAEADDRVDDVEQTERMRATIEIAEGHVARRQGELEKAEKKYEESLEICRELDNRPGEAASLGNLGVVAGKRGDLDAAEEYHEESLDIKREVGDRHGQARSLGNLGLVARKRGDLETARSRFETEADLHINVGAVDDAETALDAVVDVCEEMGDIEAAREWCERAIAVAERAGREAMREEFRQRLASLDDTDTGEEDVT